MSHLRSSQGGFGLVVMVVVLAFVLMLLTSLTASVMYFTARSVDHARAMRARALAEAGIESVIANVSTNPTGISVTHLKLDGGECAVTVKGSIISSKGKVTLGKGDGAMVCTVVVKVERSVSDGKVSVRMLSRREEVHSERKVR